MKNNKRNIIYEKLKNEIIFLTYKPNQILNIKELSKKYRVSSVPIREALILLEVDKLVRLIPNKGYYVSDISFSDIIDIFDFRMLLLEICGKLAIEKITKDEINKLELLLNDLKKEKNRYEFIKIESKFHHLLNCSTKNYSLISTLEYLRNHLDRLLFFVNTRKEDSYFSKIPKDFEYIISSLKEKNEEKYIRILKEHAMGFIELVKKSIYNKSSELNKNN